MPHAKHTRTRKGQTITGGIINRSHGATGTTAIKETRLRKSQKKKRKEKERKGQLKEMGNEDNVVLNRTKIRNQKAIERKLQRMWEERREKDQEERNTAKYNFFSSSSD